MSVYSFIVDQLQHNQFAQAAVIGAPAAALSYSVRSFPGKILQSMNRFMFYNVRINSNQNSFHETLDFITDTIVNKKLTRNYVFNNARSTVTMMNTRNEWNDTTVGNASLSVGYGTHFGWFKNTPVIINRYLEDSDNSSGFKEHVSLRFLSRSSGILEQFYQYLDTFLDNKNKNNEPGVKIRRNDESSWGKYTLIRDRSLESIFSTDNAVDKLINHIHDFSSKKEWYMKRGLPYHSGILLTGSPGCGKSSIIHALASETRRSICYLDLSTVKSGEELTNLFTSDIDWYKYFLVVEDIDATGTDVKDRSDSDKSTTPTSARVQLSTLLNNLDGITTPDGLIVIGTTNHIDSLDPALIRPGRFDIVVDIRPLDRTAFAQMALFFGYDPEEYDLDYFDPVPGAQLRQLLVEGGVLGVRNYQMGRRTPVLVCA